MILPITLTITAAAIVIHLWLAFRCGKTRITSGVMLGDGGNELLLQRMRAHANFTENAPLFLIILGLVELARSQPAWLWVAGIVFILARVAHVIGMDRPAPNPLRPVSTLVSQLAMLVLGGYGLWLSYMANQPVVIG